MSTKYVAGQEEINILAEIRDLREEMRATAVKSSDDRAVILEKLAKNDADHGYIAEALLRINDAVYGNGTPGLKAITQDLDKRVGDIEGCEQERKDDAKDLKKQFRLLIFGAAGTLATIIVTWLWNIVFHAP